MRLLTLDTVVAATDLTETSDAAVITAARIAAATGASFHVAHVVPDENAATAARPRRTEFDQAIRTVFDRAKLAAEPKTHLLSGNPPRAISSLAGELDADVVVLGRRGGKHALAVDRPVGSTAYAFITRTLVPALVVEQPLSVPMQNALVAVDMSEAARGSLLVAVSWSSALGESGAGGATLTVLHVDTGTHVTDRSAHMRRSVLHDVDVLKRNASSWAGVNVEKLVIENPDPAAAIARHASKWGAQLVVLGTRSIAEHRQSMWGSVSAGVTRASSTPVLLVPPAVWRDHVRDVDPF